MWCQSPQNRMGGPWIIEKRPKTGRAREKMQAEVGPSAFFIAHWPASVRGLDLRKKAVQIMILDASVTGSVLKQESRQCGRNHAVLIPLGMVADELPHPFKQGLRHLGLQADAGAAGARGRRHSSGQGRPGHGLFRRALVSLRFRLLQGGTAAMQPVRHSETGFVKAPASGDQLLSCLPRRLVGTGFRPVRGGMVARLGSLARGCQGIKLQLPGFHRAKAFGSKSRPRMGKTRASPVGNPPRVGKNHIHRDRLTMALNQG